ncbi:DUF4198 domain-containing protein [Frigidibacter sp. ROC022]|uniref:DUF4198 domain-containing protein n=1 Tax=Frigidibacter sp. ROC022 TaxID=2971796 RepID=UPI00215B11AE|nr:DUF4198 domain-containing protein [Frigidibacter sp. ROC022]MCR8724209.1 DUF4198 domain-containing protein [Frigidibacter sp. ROC022]
MRRILLRPIRTALLCLAVCGGLTAWPGPGAAQAGQPREFWIAPESYQIDPGDQLVAYLRAGRHFEGENLGFSAGGLHRFELLCGDTKIPVEGDSGDMPAVRLEVGEEGLARIIHESSGPAVLWSDWSDFESFVRARDFPWAIEDHRDRGLPEDGFRQSAQRYAKALIAVGNGAGEDRAAGLEAEIVALANPYADDISQGLPLLVLYQGKPLKSARVTVQSRGADGQVTRRVRWTDMDGKLTVRTRPGTEYLVDAVVLRPLSGSVKNNTPVWEALWASLTFRTPDPT